MFGKLFGSKADEGFDEIMKKGAKLASAGSYEQAVRVFSKLLDMPQASSADLSRAHSNLGQAMINCGQKEEGRKHLSTARELDPGNILATLNLGIAMRDNSEHEAAVGCFSEVLERAKDGSDYAEESLAWTVQNAHKNMAFSLDRLGQYAEALKSWDLAIEAGDTEFYTRYLRGATMLMLNVDDGLQYLKNLPGNRIQIVFEPDGRACIFVDKKLQMAVRVKK